MPLRNKDVTYIPEKMKLCARMGSLIISAWIFFSLMHFRVSTETIDVPTCFSKSVCFGIPSIKQSRGTLWWYHHVSSLSLLSSSESLLLHTAAVLQKISCSLSLYCQFCTGLLHRHYHNLRWCLALVNWFINPHEYLGPHLLGVGFLVSATRNDANARHPSDMLHEARKPARFMCVQGPVWATKTPGCDRKSWKIHGKICRYRQRCDHCGILLVAFWFKQSEKNTWFCLGSSLEEIRKTYEQLPYPLHSMTIFLPQYQQYSTINV